jgi:hypothetical protein
MARDDLHALRRWVYPGPMNPVVIALPDDLREATERFA